MKIVIHGNHSCADCAAMAKHLRELGLPFEEQQASLGTEAWENPQWRETDATDYLAAITMYDGELPIVQVDGKYLNTLGACQALGISPPPALSLEEMQALLPCDEGNAEPQS